MPAELLGIADTAASSADQVVAAGSSLTVALKDAAGPDVGGDATVWVELKDDAGQYFTVDTLSWQKPAIVISGPGTYRVRRKAGVACGVFSG